MATGFERRSLTWTSLIGETSGIADGDVDAVKRLIQARRDTEFVCRRIKRNVALPAPEVAREQFWFALVGCLLTTQQPSTKDKPVNRFVNSKPFPLALDICEKQTSIEEFVLKTVQDFHGIRFGNKIADQASENWRYLNQGLWAKAEEWFAQLKQQRARKPQLMPERRTRPSGR